MEVTTTVICGAIVTADDYTVIHHTVPYNIMTYHLRQCVREREGSLLLGWHFTTNTVYMPYILL